MNSEPFNAPLQAPQEDHNKTLFTGLIAAGAVACVLVFVFIPLTVGGLTLGVNANMRKAATARAQDVEVATQTAAAAAISTGTALEALPANSIPILVETFDSNEKGWQEDTYESKSGGSSTGLFKDGRYFFSVTDDLNGHIWWSIPYKLNYTPSSFYQSVAARQIAGEADSSYGLIFNVPSSDDEWTVFQIAENGYFRISNKDSGKVSSLVPWTHIDSIHHGEPNRLTIREQGGHYRFFVNGILVYETETLGLPKGEAGVIIEPEDNTIQNFEFDNYSLFSVSD